MSHPFAHFIGTFGFVGHLRPAPGTWGSLAALPAALALHWLGGAWLVAVAACILFIAGVWATRIYTHPASPGAASARVSHDPSEIVIDEVVGQWIALFPILFAASRMGLDPLVMWPGWIAAFGLFRLFDITKPGPVGWADRRADAMGVMLDDVIAGVFAAIGVLILAAVYHMGLT